MLTKHSELGLIRGSTECDLPANELKARLEKLGENIDPDISPTDIQAHYKRLTTTRHLKIWHDHSTVGGHGHFLVLVSAVYDPAFYFTSAEMKEKGIIIDVQSVVETPEIHILGHSTSSLDNQAADLNHTLNLSTGEEVTDIIRFFHGDGPAAQFESGNTIGGNYCCVGCGARSDRLDDTDAPSIL